KSWLWPKSGELAAAVPSSANGGHSRASVARADWGSAAAGPAPLRGHRRRRRARGGPVPVRWHQRSQGGDDRAVRHLPPREVDALADEDPGPAVGRAPLELGDQT